ncbi:MAG: hypothetical protein AAGG68_16140 [Bacteroidota bacterium]
MKIYLLLFFSLFSILSYAQENSLIKKINWSEKHAISEDLQLVDVITHKDEFYTIRENKSQRTPLFIGMYDKNMNSKKETGFDPTARGENWTYEGLFWIKDQFQLFSSFYDVEAARNILYRQSIRKGKKGLKIGELEQLTDFSVRKKYDLGEFEILPSSSEEVLMTCSTIPNQSEKSMLQIRLFDEQFVEKMTKTIVLPYAKEHLEVVEKRIDKTGNFYILGRLYQKGRVDRRNGAPNYKYILMVYTRHEQQVQTYSLSIDDYLVTDLKFDFGEKNEVLLAGLISDAGNAKTNGICYFRADLAKAKLTLTAKSLFQTQPITLAAAQTVNAETIKIPRYLKIDHLFLRSDGGALMIAERSFQVSKYTYQDDDILVFNISPEGALDWVSQVPKKQSSYYTEDVLLSYFPFVAQDKIYLIYNDDGRNFSYNKQRKRIQRHKTVKGYAALTEIQKDGTWRSYPLNDNSIADLVIHPQVCEQIGQKTILIYEAFGNTYRFGKLELK